MLVLTSFLVMGLGVFCIINKDLAWALYEWDSQSMGNRRPARGKHWRMQVQYASLSLIMLGMIGMNTAIQSFL